MSADDSGLVRGWEEGEPVHLKRRRPPTSVLSIRVPAELQEALSRRAADEGKPTSHIARDLLETGLVRQVPSTPPELAKAFTRWVEELDSSSFAVRLDQPTVRALRDVAKVRGLGVTQLIRAWVLERVEAEQRIRDR